MKVLITGGAGFIGSYICRELVRDGNHDVVVLDNLSNPVGLKLEDYMRVLELRFSGIIDKIKFIHRDVTDGFSVRKCIGEQKPDCVIHLAAMPIASLTSKIPYESVRSNLFGTAEVLEAVRRHNVNRIIFASSSFAYGNFPYEPIDEDAQLNPLDLYGGCKVAGEILVENYSRQFGIDYTIIRPSGVYGGPEDINNRVTGILMKNAVLGKPVFIEDEGEQRIDFTYVKDTANGFVLAMESDRAINETFNITRGEGRTIKELYDIINSIVPFKSVEYKKSEHIRPKRGTLSIERAKNFLNYKPEYDLEKGIKESLEGYRKFYGK